MPLTIEEKAKSYDELLDKAKQIYNKENDVLIMHTIEDLFPQLKESKDERIREALIENFKWFCGDYPETTKWGKDDDLFVKDILAWLEKQGEHERQVNFPQFTFDDVLALQCAMENVKKVQEDKDLYNELLLLHNKVHDAYTITKR